jgi:hypothetical protein
MTDGAAQILAKILSGKDGRRELVIERPAAATGDGIMLYSLLAQDDLSRAENALFAELRAYFDLEAYGIGLSFYERLAALTDETLQKCNFSRERIYAGQERLYGVLLSYCGIIS